MGEVLRRAAAGAEADALVASGTDARNLHHLSTAAASPGDQVPAGSGRGGCIRFEFDAYRTTVCDVGATVLYTVSSKAAVPQPHRPSVGFSRVVVSEIEARLC